MIRKRFSHSILGSFVKWFGPWKGCCHIPGWDEPVPLIVEVEDCRALTTSLDNLARVLRSNDTKGQISDDLYQSYSFFKQMDLDAGLTKDDFADFPPVYTASDVYGACDPYRIRIGNRIAPHLGNMYVLFHVDWPNDHMLQLFWQLDDARLEYKHVELFG